MVSATDRAVARLASRQGGVVAREQALDLGLGPSGVARRLKSGEWTRLQPRAYRVELIRPERSATLWAAVLSAPGSVVAGTSAAWWHGMIEQPPLQPQVVVPVSLHGLALRGVRVQRSTLDPLDRTVRRGLPVVGKALAVLQSTALLPAGAAALMDRALQEWVTWSQLSAAADRFRRHRGAARANALLRSAADGAASEAERIALATLRSAAIRGWLPNHPVGRYLVDIAFPDQRLAVEIDGWAWHHDPERFQRDRTRQNQLSLAGWQVLRFTWADLQDPAHFLGQVAAALTPSEVA